MQFQITNRYYPCNLNLYLWKLKESNKCNVCTSIDTIEHHFVECEAIKVFWNHIKKWYKHDFNMTINFTTLDVLLGIPNTNHLNEIHNLNFMLLYGKYFISKCKKQNRQPHLYEFQVALKERLMIEELNCKLKDREYYFKSRWKS